MVKWLLHWPDAMLRLFVRLKESEGRFTVQILQARGPFIVPSHRERYLVTL